MIPDLNPVEHIFKGAETFHLENAPFKREKTAAICS